MATVASKPSTRSLAVIVRMLASESPGCHIDAVNPSCVAQT
jgi:hypothetical protein